jgi:hypothetical protein
VRSEVRQRVHPILRGEPQVSLMHANTYRSVCMQGIAGCQKMPVAGGRCGEDHYIGDLPGRSSIHA